MLKQAEGTLMEELSKETVRFQEEIQKDFSPSNEARDFVKENSPDVKLSTGNLPIKRKLNTDCSELKDDNVRVKLLEKLQGIQEKMQLLHDNVKTIQQFHDNIVNEINSMMEELAGNGSQPPKKVVLVDIGNLQDLITEETSSYLPSTSDKGFGKPLEIVVEDDTVSTFKVDNDGYVEVYIDGAFINHDKGEAKAGVGVWFGEGHSLNISVPWGGRMAKSYVEIKAAILAIEFAKLAGVRKLKVFTGSTFVMQAVTTWIPNMKMMNWKTAKGKMVKRKEEFMLLDQAHQDIDVKFCQVRYCDNGQAVALARAGAEKCRQISPLQSSDSQKQMK